MLDQMWSNRAKFSSILRSFYSIKKLSRWGEGDLILTGSKASVPKHKKGFSNVQEWEWCSRTIGHSVIRQST